MKKLLSLLIVLTAVTFQAFAGLKMDILAVTTQQVQSAENQLTQVYQQLRGTLDEANQKKLKDSEVKWIKEKEAAIASNPQNADLVHYQIVQNRTQYLSSFLNSPSQTQQVAPPPQQANQNPITERKINSPAEPQEKPVRFSRNRIEGETYGDHWAYEFLENQAAGKPLILDNPSGAVIFQNPDWIVKAFQEASNVGKVKTDLFFYNSRTLNLVASARIPNKLIKLGRVGNPNVFYVVTITPSKYRYDDSPLAICLINPNAKEKSMVKEIRNKICFFNDF